LKRCISIERRWNSNEVSRESPDKEVNRRPTSLKKFRADALRGQGYQLRPVIIIIIILFYFFSHQVVKIPGVKNYKSLLLLLLFLSQPAQSRRQKN